MQKLPDRETTKMAVHRRKPLELVFNLQWINGDDKLIEQNIIGMVDTLITTLSFEKFKSYLLKNSGVATDDIKVTYVNNKNREWVIDSEERFESALQAFRLKARCGEKIHLKLERISNTGAIKRTSSVRTQCTQVCNNETPPEWFINYMKQFKTEVIDEIKSSINPSSPIQLKTTVPETSTSNNIDDHLFNNINCYKKLKKTRKLLPKNHHHHHYYHNNNNENQIDKELLRTLKYDRKLEVKLDKLDAKTKKIKEKKQSLVNKLPLEIIGNTNNDNNDENHQDNTNENQNNGSDTIDNKDNDDLLLYDEHGQPLMDAAVIMHLPDIKHMCGGEIYSHTWNVINKGELSFTDRTELRWTWGSAELKPETKSIKLPLLNPGQIGSVKVTFQIPCDGGKYESYWNFYHGELRFGSWLSCTIIVDPPPKLPELILSPIQIDGDQLKTDCATEQSVETASIVTLSSSSSSSSSDDDNVKIDNNVVETKPESELAEKMDKILLSDASTIGIDYDDDNDSDSFEKVVVYGISEDELIVDLPDKEETKRNQSIAEEIKDAESKQINQDDNNNNTSGAVNNSRSSSSSLDSDFVFVEIDGNKISLPRHIINPELLKSLKGKEENDVKIAAKDEQPVESNNFLSTVQHFTADLHEFESFISHCSTAGTNFSDTNLLPSSSSSSSSSTTTTTTTTNNLLDSTVIRKDGSNSQSSSNESRLFIFPQNNPGYEVVNKPDEHLRDSGKIPPCTTNETQATAIEPEPNYIWAQSQTQYTLADIPNRSVLEKFDPYRPEQQQQQFNHVPNYQQTPKPNRKNNTNSSQYKATAPPPPPQQHSTPTASTSNNRNGQDSQNTTTPHPGVPVHILPENLVSGAVNVASSAINTARSVINMMIPPKTEPGRWVNGHWVTDRPESKRSRNIRILVDMGFWDIDYNATLLARYNDDLNKVVDELLK